MTTIYIEEDFALPNGSVNPAFATQWDLYTKLVGQPEFRNGLYIFKGINRNRYLKIDDVIALSMAAPNNEVELYPVWVEMTDLEREQLIPNWVRDSAVLDEEGDVLGQKKWSEWYPEQHQQYDKWYIPTHLFNISIGLKGSEMYQLQQDGYTIISEDDFIVIRDAWLAENV